MKDKKKNLGRGRKLLIYNRKWVKSKSSLISNKFETSEAWSQLEAAGSNRNWWSFNLFIFSFCFDWFSAAYAKFKLQTSRMFNWTLYHPHLLKDGGVASSRGHPHFFVEMITDGVGDIDAGVIVATQDSPVQRVGGRHIKREQERLIYIQWDWSFNGI